jgi:hypothetical protein
VILSPSKQSTIATLYPQIAVINAFDNAMFLNGHHRVIRARRRINTLPVMQMPQMLLIKADH